MHEEEVEVVDAKVLQRRIESWLDIVGVMGVVPQLGSDEDLISRNAALLDSLADIWFGSVSASVRLRPIQQRKVETNIRAVSMCR